MRLGKAKGAGAVAHVALAGVWHGEKAFQLAERHGLVDPTVVELRLREGGGGVAHQGVVGVDQLGNVGVDDEGEARQGQEQEAGRAPAAGFRLRINVSKASMFSTSCDSSNDILPTPH